MNLLESERLVRELTAITVDPTSHDQSTWLETSSEEIPEKTSACGTFGCLAGNVVLHEGLKIQWHVRTKYNVDTDEYVATGWQASSCVDAKGTQRTIRDMARELFGLSEDQAYDLFAASNTVARLWSYAIEFSNGMIDTSDMARAYSMHAKAEYQRGKEEGRDEVKTFFRTLLDN